MIAAQSWHFDADKLDLEGDMTLVLVSRVGKNLRGSRIEFADDATTEMRKAIKSATALITSLSAKNYEPSLRITSGEYLAVPDQLVERRADNLIPKPKTKASTSSSQKEQSVGVVSKTPVDVVSGESKGKIVTDPQVRNLLKNASGLELLAAQSLSSAHVQFYAIVVGSDPSNRTSFVRKMNPTRSLDAGRGMHVFSMGERLQRVSEPLLSLDNHFDLVVTTEGIAVLNQDIFDALFRDAKTLVDRYPQWAKAFSKLGLDKAQTQHLVNRCQSNNSLATRLRQIHESGHLKRGNVSLEDVLLEADRVAGGRSHFIKDGKLDFEGTDVATLLKLLNEDLFIGGLSKESYEAGSKARRSSK